MVYLPGFINLEQILISNGFSAFRGQREQDKSKVLLKVLDAGRVTIEVSKQFNNEYKRVCDFDFDGVLKPSSLEDCGDYKIMIFEDRDYQFLNEVLDQQVLSLDEALVIANKLIVAIGELHSWQIAHKKICPSDILFNPDTKAIYLFGAGIFDTSHFWNKNEEYKRNFLYVAPEVKLLTNFRSDYRSDYFSFGVILHQMLAGFLPFTNDSFVGYSEQEISLVPAKGAQSAAMAPVPNVVIDIVRKLLSIEPIERYQSVWGINADLEQCVDQLRARGKIYHFPLARHDVSSQFSIPEKLYGRENEMRQLLDSYSRVSKGTRETFAIYGDAGIGKTSIVNEVKHTVERRNGIFISGNFDGDYSDISNGAIIDAVKEFIVQVIMPDTLNRDYWSELVLDAVGDSGQVLIDLIPELELLIGSQSKVEKLEHLESKNRFKFLLQSLIQNFSHARKPIVLFLDNFHLADISTVEFLQSLLTNCDTNYLLVLLVYRKDEFYANKSLNNFLQELERKGEKVKELHLCRLLLQHISQLVVDALYSDKTEINALAKLIETKTNGNPLFIDEFLKTLFAEQMIYFDSTQGKWYWDLKEIQSRDSFDNVVDFVAGRIVRMGGQVQKLLSVASAIGSKFDIHLVSIVLDRPIAEIAALLNELILSGVVYELGDAKVNVGKENEPHNVAVNYRFSHDVVRFSIATLSSPQMLSKLHNDIGVALSECNSDDSTIFEITDQLNAGAVISELDEDRRGKLIHLNLRAAERAKRLNAHLFAFRYLSFALKILGINGWTKFYDLTASLHIDVLRCSYLNNDYSKMNQLFDKAIENAVTPIDRARMYEVLMDGYIKKRELVKAGEYLLLALKELGFNIAEKPSKFKIYLEFLKVRRKFIHRDLEYIVDMPQMTDKVLIETIRIAQKGSVSLYFTHPELFVLLILKAVSITIKQGIAAESPVVLSGLATVVCSAVGDVDLGYQLGKLALSLAKKLGKKEIESRVKFVVAFFILRFKGHLKNVKALLEDSHKECKKFGDFEYASFALLAMSMTDYYIGTNLGVLRKTLSDNMNVMQRMDLSKEISIYKLINQLVINLSEPVENFALLEGEIFNEQVQKPAFIMSGDRVRLFYYHCFKVVLNFANDDYFAALNEINEGENYKEYIIGHYENLYFEFFDSLTRLAVYYDNSVSRAEQKMIIKRVKANQKKLANWAKFSPENNQHKYYLVEAELNRVLGNELKAVSLYGQSIEHAKKNGFINEAATANELAAKFYIETGKTRMAEVYMQSAHALYKEWGANAIAAKLERKYPQLIESEVFAGVGLTKLTGFLNGK